MDLVPVSTHSPTQASNQGAGSAPSPTFGGCIGGAPPWEGDTIPVEATTLADLAAWAEEVSAGEQHALRVFLRIGAQWSYQAPINEGHAPGAKVKLDVFAPACGLKGRQVQHARECYEHVRDNHAGTTPPDWTTVNVAKKKVKAAKDARAATEAKALEAARRAKLSQAERDAEDVAAESERKRREVSAKVDSVAAAVLVDTVEAEARTRDAFLGADGTAVAEATVGRTLPLLRQALRTMGRGPARDAYLSALEALVAEERESEDEPEPADPIDELLAGLEVAS